MSASQAALSGMKRGRSVTTSSAPAACLDGVNLTVFLVLWMVVREGGNLHWPLLRLGATAGRGGQEAVCLKNKNRLMFPLGLRQLLQT